MGGNPTTHQTQTTEMTPEQSSFYNMAFPFLKNFSSNPLQTYGGETVAGFNPYDIAAQKGALDATGEISRLGAGAASANELMTDPNFMLNPESNPYFGKSMKNMADVTERELAEKELPALRQGEVQAGGAYSGGDTKGGIAEALATERTNRAISDAITSGYSNLYRTGLEGMATGVGQTPQVQAEQLFSPDVYGAVGSQQRNLEQQRIDEAVQKFYTGEELPFLQGSELMSMIGATPGSTTTATGTGAAPQTSPWQMAGGIGSLLSGLFGGGSGGGLFGANGLGSLSSLGSSLWGGLSSLGSSGMGWLSALMML